MERDLEKGSTAIHRGEDGPGGDSTALKKPDKGDG